MSAESAAKSIKMLKAVLEGKTYQAVARESGLSVSVNSIWPTLIL